MTAFFKTLPAALFTGAAVTGIVGLIALDLLGAQTLGRVWQQAMAAAQPTLDLSDLETAKDFTFFSTASIDGAGAEITTGVAFASWDDLLAGRQSSRWCYVMVQTGGSLPRQITLGRQIGSDAPVFTDPAIWPAHELSELGLGAAELATLARRTCRFLGTSPDEDIDSAPRRTASLSEGRR